MITLAIIVAAVGISFYMIFVIMNPKYKKIRFEFTVDGYTITEYRKIWVKGFDLLSELYFRDMLNKKVNFDLETIEQYDVIQAFYNDYKVWYDNDKWVSYLPHKISSRLIDIYSKKDISIHKMRRLFE